MNKESKEIVETEVLEDITDEWDQPMTCPIDPKLLAECEACQ